jgi:stalled ribosome rescue protein Dom34
VAEDTQEHKFMNQLNTYYDEVRTCLRDADSILILGPGEAKGEFQKRLKSKKFPAHVVELKTADKMTDHQIAASVRQHFLLVPGQDCGKENTSGHAS